MSKSDTVLNEIYKLLYSHFGPQHWWPGDSPFEICLGAILTQNTNWTNVEKTIENLKKQTFLITKNSTTQVMKTLLSLSNLLAILIAKLREFGIFSMLFMKKLSLLTVCLN